MLPNFGQEISCVGKYRRVNQTHRKVQERHASFGIYVKQNKSWYSQYIIEHKIHKRAL